MKSQVWRVSSASWIKAVSPRQEIEERHSPWTPRIRRISGKKHAVKKHRRRAPLHSLSQHPRQNFGSTALQSPSGERPHLSS
ncbi:hypothetical protein L596_015484 [Steinernema carpocapsae]|uniref:Uncharacterized protein n=1 Tax=Steinernema carpocapsae TaxID=34508 RepID=A0A4V6A346_STECR|nr:hypothetical protein L596_015484 [Steinernema carpocapsae]